MTIIRRTLAEARAEPFRFTAEQRARLDAMTDDEIDALAESDPDNPPLTDEQLDRMVAMRSIRLACEALGFSLAEFAARFHVPLDRLSEWEAGRSSPDGLTLAYLRVIEREPEAALRALSGEVSVQDAA